MTEPKEQQPVSERSVSRVLCILEEVAGADSPPTQVEVARAVGLAKSTVSDILAALRKLGYVELVDRRYRPGPQLVALGHASTKISQLRLRLRRTLEWLVAELGETVLLWVETGATDKEVGVLSCVDFVESQKAVRYVPQPGRPQPMYPSAAGRVLIAFTGRDASFLGPHLLVKRTEHTVTDKALIDKDLIAVRARGYAVSRSEGIEGLAAIAAPVFGTDGRVLATLSVCGPTERFKSAGKRLWPKMSEALRDVNEGTQPRLCARG
jgi:DNA-binding IclR family transcriptional regulator